MARIKTLSGEVVTVTESKGSDVTNRHWWLVNGTAQGVIDYLEENKIDRRYVKQFVLSTTWYVWFYKG